MLYPTTLQESQVQPQPGPATRSVEGDVKRLADIRASLQDIQRRKSAPTAGNLGTESSGRFKSYAGVLTPPQLQGENAYPLLHSSPYLINQNRPQPFAQRDLNSDAKVLTALHAIKEPSTVIAQASPNICLISCLKATSEEMHTVKSTQLWSLSVRSNACSYRPYSLAGSPQALGSYRLR